MTALTLGHLITLTLGFAGITYLMPFDFVRRWGMYGFFVSLTISLLRLHDDLQQIITLLEKLP